MMINDEYSTNSGSLEIRIEDESNNLLLKEACPYEVADNSQKTYQFDLKFPVKPGNYKLLATAIRSDNNITTTSTRLFKIL